MIMSEQNVQEDSTTANSTTESTEVRPNLTLQDLTLMAEIIQECTGRGVWRASELSSVGSLYDRLEKFLQAAGIDINKNNKR